MSDTCRSCGAALLWAITPKGKRMPLDAAPVEGGLWFAYDVAGEKHCAPARAGAEGPLYTSHFATCPQADQHRRRR
jgi:hypothetical protein